MTLPIPEELARSIDAGSLGTERVYAADDAFAAAVRDGLVAAGWREEQWIREPLSSFSAKLVNCDRSREILVIAYGRYNRVEVDVFPVTRRRRTT